MNTRILLFFTVVLLVAACNDNKQSTTNTETTASDSAKEANKIYTSKLIDLSQSRDMHELLCQGWVLEDDLDAISSSNESMGMLPYRSYYLSFDSSFVKNPRNAMEYGRWLYDANQKTITLLYSNGTRDVYKIAALAPGELVLVNTGIESATKLKFVSSAKRYKHISDDPFYISNNGWRIKPKKQESEEQIRQRLKNYLYFHILFYRDNLAHESKTISFYGFPTCLKWYAGGIYIVKEQELNENWFHCFYSKEQAMVAYKMMDALLSRKYDWPKGKISWIKKNLAVLEQMYDRL